MQPVTISASASISAFTALGPLVICGLFTDANWTQEKITLQVSPDGGTTFVELVDDTGAEITLGSATAIPASTFVAIDPATYQGFNGVKIRSGTSASPTTQTSTTTVTLALRAPPLA